MENARNTKIDYIIRIPKLHILLNKFRIQKIFGQQENRRNTKKLHRSNFKMKFLAETEFGERTVWNTLNFWLHSASSHWTRIRGEKITEKFGKAGKSTEYRQTIILLSFQSSVSCWTLFEGQKILGQPENRRNTNKSHYTHPNMKFVAGHEFMDSKCWKNLEAEIFILFPFQC